MPSHLIEIPPDDIFKNDRLGLEPAIAGRTHALLAQSPQAIAIDGRWGTGKSTFLALWEAYLRREGVKVVHFNAWKTFGADPLDALTREILRQVAIPDEQQEGPHRRIVAFLKQNAPLVAQGAKLASALHPELEGVTQAIEAGVSVATKMPGTEVRGEPEPAIDSPDAFAAVLSSAAKTWSNRPVVVMVDELDRCNPEYAVEFLQLLEHVFHAEHVVFVVAVNQSELINSIKSFYGQNFDAAGYLERFFDDILPLPKSRRSQYIGSSLRTIESLDTMSASEFLDASELSLREIDKAIQVLKSVVETYKIPASTTVDLWIARTVAPVPYRQFVSRTISDKELVDALFGNGNCQSLRSESPRQLPHDAQRVEANMIICSGILSGKSMWHFKDVISDESELFRYYNTIVTNASENDESNRYARGVIEIVSALTESFNSMQSIREVAFAVRLLGRELPPESVSDTP